MLVAEDVLLLLTDGRSGQLLASRTRTEVALAGALVMDLTLRGYVELKHTEGASGARLVRQREGPTGDPLLDLALQAFDGSRARGPSMVVLGLEGDLRGAVTEQLVTKDVLEARRGHTYGVFPTWLWHVKDSARPDAVRDRLREILLFNGSPDPRELALISVLHGARAAPAVLATTGVSRGTLRRRARSIAADAFITRAIRVAARMAWAWDHLSFWTKLDRFT